MLIKILSNEVLITTYYVNNHVKYYEKLCHWYFSINTLIDQLLKASNCSLLTWYVSIPKPQINAG